MKLITTLFLGCAFTGAASAADFAANKTKFVCGSMSEGLEVAGRVPADSALNGDALKSSEFTINQHPGQSRLYYFQTCADEGAKAPCTETRILAFDYEPKGGAVAESKLTEAISGTRFSGVLMIAGDRLTLSMHQMEPELFGWTTSLNCRWR